MTPRAPRPPRASRPPQIPGLLAPSPRDTLRSVWWAELGFLHGARHAATIRGKIAAAVLALCWWPCYPLVASVQLVYARRPWARYYLTPERDTLLAVSATRHGWFLEDHVSRQVGRGRGRALRDQVRPTLLDAADRAGIPIYTVAADPRLAARYCAELPGLTDTGPAWPRGRKLRREPMPSSGAR